MQIKTCTKCCEPKSIDEFGPRRGSKDGKRSECRKCQNKRQCEWQRKNPDKINAYHRTWKKKNPEKLREYDRLYQAKARVKYPNRHKEINRRAKCKAYGVTVEWYDQQLEKQNSVCAICAQACKSGRQLAIDHDHVSGKARGLLCADCNGALARLEAIEGWAVKAIDYLKQYA